MLDQIRIVLIGTTHSGNIGAAARAMKNMGISQLTLVDPVADIDSEAVVRASGATEILDNATIVATLEQAVADCSMVIGTSARSRHIPWPLCNPRQCASKARQAVVQGNKIALVFGRESSGLSNEELQRCNLHVHIPTDENFSSLNVASAVQVLCYEMRMASLESEGSDGEQHLQWGVPWDYEMATHEELERFYEHLQATLVDIGFLDPNTPKQLMTRLRRLYGRAALDKTEVSMMRGMLKETQRQVQQQEQINK